MPYSKWNWLTEPFVVLFYFPLIVALGAGSVLAPTLRNVCSFSGKISYPLYMTHYAALWMFGNYYTTQKPAGLQLVVIIVGAIFLLIELVYFVMVMYDISFRRYLSGKLKRRFS